MLFHKSHSIQTISHLITGGQERGEDAAQSKVTRGVGSGQRQPGGEAGWGRNSYGGGRCTTYLPYRGWLEGVTKLGNNTL